MHSYMSIVYNQALKSMVICLLGFSHIRLPLLRECFWVPVPEVEEEWEEHQDKSMESYRPVIQKSIEFAQETSGLPL